jgi:hypothetical protein
MFWCFTDRHIPTLIPKKKANVTHIDSRELQSPHEINPRIPMALSRLIVDCVQNRPSHRPQDFTAVIPRLELSMSVVRADDRNAAAQDPLTSSDTEK